MSLRNGSTRAPAGRISSVDMLSPTLIATRARKSAGSSSNSGSVPMLGALTSSTWRASPSSSGASSGMSPSPDRDGRLREPRDGYSMPSRDGRSRGSVISPVRTAAAAVSGEHSQTESSSVPDRPGKLRGTYRGRLPHADAPYAAGLVDPRPGLDQAERPAHSGQVGEDLPRGGVDVHGHL